MLSSWQVALLFLTLLAVPTVTSAADGFVEDSDFTFEDECLNQNNPAAQAVGINPNAANYNAKCDHEWALKSGNSVYYVYQRHAEKKLEMAQRPGKSLQDLVSEGVCVEGEKDLNACVERLKREALAAKIEARDKTLQHNKARLEMTTKGNPAFTPEGGSQPAAKRKTTVLNDFYRMSKKNPKNAAQLLAPQEIVFTPQKGAIEGARLKKAEQRKIEDAETKRKLGVEDAPIVETESGETDEKLQQSLDKALKDDSARNAYSLKKFEKDDRVKKNALEKSAKDKKKISIKIRDNTSVKAFEGVMDEIQDEVKKGPGESSKTQGLDAPGEKQIHIVTPIERSDVSTGNIGIKLEKELKDAVDPLH
ncbi:MAG: hypothetical protein HYW49_03990 [Deltaproteobacteria bacterium]|nr:hypothetical protein [Deltaproteobacteria bacterium]